MKKFADYLFEKLHERESILGRRVTLSEFAEYLHVTQSNISYWLRGDVMPSSEKIAKIALVLGDDVLQYANTGVDMDLVYLNDVWNRLDINCRNFIRECAENHLNASENDLEDKEQLIDIMRKWAAEHGYSIVEASFSKGNKSDHQSRS